MTNSRDTQSMSPNIQMEYLISDGTSVRLTVQRSVPSNMTIEAAARTFIEARPMLELIDSDRCWTIDGMPFQIRTTRCFSAAHALRLYDQSTEPVHGHNWKVEVTVQSPELDSIGVVMDFHELERLLDAIIQPFHNRHLNLVPPFDVINPTAENVALHIGRSLVVPLPARVVSVQVWETEHNAAVYLVENP
jgi:6-pyruvoyltetrahydropterin/6-carboxytetrahydropterin synthase